MNKLIFDKKILRKFGITMGMAFFVISLFIFMRHKHSVLTTTMISAIFFILAAIAPILLRPIYIFWMGLAFVLGWINTRLILFIIFYLIFTPISLGIKLLGIDLLDRKKSHSKESYWRKKEKKDFNPLDYERQF